jgi:hypothetical protein
MEVSRQYHEPLYIGILVLKSIGPCCNDKYVHAFVIGCFHCFQRRKTKSSFSGQSQLRVFIIV